MIHFQEFSSQDGQDKLDFLKAADFKVRGFKIVGMFEDVETVEQMRTKIKELQELSDKDPCERKFYWILKDSTPIGVITLRPALNGFWLHNAGHIGIAIDKPYRGQNYGTEAFKKMCENRKERASAMMRTKERRKVWQAVIPAHSLYMMIITRIMCAM